MSPPGQVIVLPNPPPTLTPTLPPLLKPSPKQKSQYSKTNHQNRRQHRDDASEERDRRDVAAQRTSSELPALGPKRAYVRIVDGSEDLDGSGVGNTS